MKTKYLTFGITLFALPLLAGISGCAVPREVTGGGTLPAAYNYRNRDSTYGRATFEFGGSSCPDGKTVRGHFRYYDKNWDLEKDLQGGAELNGKVIGGYKCPDKESPICRECYGLMGLPFYAVKFSYRSINPNARGEGYGFACFKEKGEGPNAQADLALIQIDSGPFVGYFNFGEVQGNIQAHECD